MNAPLSRPPDSGPPPRPALTLIDAADEPAGPEPAWPAPKKYRGGVVTLAAELRTARVRQFHRREFGQLSEWLVGLERARTFQAVGATRIDAAQAAIASHLAAERHAFDAAAQHTDTLLAEQGLGDIPIDYLHRCTLAVPIFDPLARSVLQMLVAADDAFAGVDRAWLLGLLDTPQRRTQEAVFQRRLRETKAVVREQHVHVGRLLRHPDRRPPKGPQGQPPGGPARPDESVVSCSEGRELSPEAQDRLGPGAQAPEAAERPTSWWEGPHA